MAIEDAVRENYDNNTEFIRQVRKACDNARVDISGTTAKSRQRKFVPSSHPGPFAVVATSPKSQAKVGTLACLILL